MAATSKALSIKKLSLDLPNYRTVKQKSERGALEALVEINDRPFWALTRSLLTHGYMPTEQIVVQKQSNKYVVKEGNRRVAAMKLILGLLKSPNVSVPTDIVDQISRLNPAIKKSLSSAPCLVFRANQTKEVDQIITRIHGKSLGEGRVRWEAIAIARHDRDVNKNSQPVLDILESFLNSSTECTKNESSAWTGDYPLSVLAEALTGVVRRLRFESLSDLHSKYPSNKKVKNFIDRIIVDVGRKILTFPKIRDKQSEFGALYGLPPITKPTPSPRALQELNVFPSPNGQESSKGSKFSASPSVPVTAASRASNSVASILRNFHPRVTGSEKLVTLSGELKTLNLNKCPHAFCYLLRSMFEISAKLYIERNRKRSQLRTHDEDGKELSLKDKLNQVIKHMVKFNPRDDDMLKKRLYSAQSVINDKFSILSVRSLNELVHNTHFITSADHIRSVLHNVMPLLEEMNR